MCEPATIALAATAASGVMQAYGQMQQGKAAKAEANYRAALQRNNATRAEYAAQDALERGSEAERQQRVKGRLLLGQMRAVLGSSGQVVDEGSAGELVVDQAGISEQDALTVRSNAEREAFGFRTQAQDFRSEAGLTEMAGANAARSSKFAAAGTLLSTGGTVASQWYGFKKAGAFGGGGGDFTQKYGGSGPGR